MRDTYILVVEDEKRLADALAQILTEQKYMVDVVYDGAEGYEYASGGIYDCIILDVMLPSMDGFEVISALRGDKNSTPVLMLTARDTLSDKIKGLDSGADDYMTKPFAPEELLARIRVLSRRKGEVVIDEISVADLRFLISASELICTATGRSVRLNYKESAMLRIFAEKAGVIHSKEELITKIWGYNSDAGDNNVEAYISFLRKKLSFVGSECELVSVKKLGYMLEVPRC